MLSEPSQLYERPPLGSFCSPSLPLVYALPVIHSSPYTVVAQSSASASSDAWGGWVHNPANTLTLSSLPVLMSAALSDANIFIALWIRWD